MTRENLIAILDECKQTSGSPNFTFSVNPPDARSVSTRLRHMREDDLIDDFDIASEISDHHFHVYGYGE